MVIKSTTTELEEVQAAITKVLEAQSLGLGDKTLMRAKLEALTAREEILLRAIQGRNGNRRVLDQQRPREALRWEAALTLTLRNLPPLDDHQGTYRLWGRIYEFARAPAGGGYAVLHSEMVPLGDFHVDPATGAALDSAGRPARFLIPEEWDPQLVASVMVSVEPAHPGSGPLHEHPGPVIMADSLTGDRFTGMASLSPAHPEALGANLLLARGMYTVIAPTSPSDSTSGVWFVDYTTAPPSPLQDLPLLPPGWVYEGWAVDRAAQPAIRYSAGRFVRPDSADRDGPGPGRGPLPSAPVGLGAPIRGREATGSLGLVTWPVPIQNPPQTCLRSLQRQKVPAFERHLF